MPEKSNSAVKPNELFAQAAVQSERPSSNREATEVATRAAGEKAQTASISDFNVSATVEIAAFSDEHAALYSNGTRGICADLQQDPSQLSTFTL